MDERKIAKIFYEAIVNKNLNSLTSNLSIEERIYLLKNQDSVFSNLTEEELKYLEDHPELVGIDIGKYIFTKEELKQILKKIEIVNDEILNILNTSGYWDEIIGELTDKEVMFLYNNVKFYEADLKVKLLDRFGDEKYIEELIEITNTEKANSYIDSFINNPNIEIAKKIIRNLSTKELKWKSLEYIPIERERANLIIELGITNAEEIEKFSKLISSQEERTRVIENVLEEIPNEELLNCIKIISDEATKEDLIEKTISRIPDKASAVKLINNELKRYKIISRLSDEEKKQCLHLLDNERLKSGIIKSFESDEDKKDYLHLLNDEILIREVICTFKRDEDKKAYLNILEYDDQKEGYIEIIKSLESNNQKLESLSISIPSIKIKDLRESLLENAKNIAGNKAEKYRNLSRTITSSLDTKTIFDLFNEEYETITEMCNTLNIELDNLAEIFNNYQETHNPEIIIELVRTFIAKYKEQTALSLVAEKMKELEVNYSILPREKIIIEIQKQKRKEILLKDFMTGKINDLNIQEISIPGLSTEELFRRIVFGEEILKEPSFYHVIEIQKNYNRILQNYDGTILEILNNNQENMQLILDFLNGKIKINEVKKVLDKKTCKTLEDIKSLMKNDISIEYVDGKIIWNKFFKNLTEEEIKICKEYEEINKKINKLRGKINKKMNELYPLQKIAVTEEEIQESSARIHMDNELILDIDKVSGEKFNMILDILQMNRKKLTEDKQKYFDKLLIESGMLYSTFFIDDEKYYSKLLIIIENLEIIQKLYPNGKIPISQLNTITNKLVLRKYCNETDFNILGDDICYKIVNNTTFISNTSEIGTKQRIAYGTKYNIFSNQYIESTIPYTKVKRNGITAERYNNNDPNILIAGIDTDACFRIMGNDNDFLLYTMFDKNGIVLKLTDEDGKFIGRCSGFRNGNIVYFNQARSIYDQHGNPGKEFIELQDTFRETIIEYAERLIKDTKDSAHPIEHVVILRAYGFSLETELPTVNRSLISQYPMNTESEDWKKFKNNPVLSLRENSDGFTTDYAGGLEILILASKEGCTLDKPEDIKHYDPEATHYRPRKEITIYDSISNKALQELNRIKAIKSYIDETPFEELLESTQIANAIIGEDWYSITYTDGRVEECVIPLDPRATEEMKEYKENMLSDKIHLHDKKFM